VLPGCSSRCKVLPLEHRREDIEDIALLYRARNELSGRARNEFMLLRLLGTGALFPLRGLFSPSTITVALGVSIYTSLLGAPFRKPGQSGAT
jgi:hypothetical protein